MLNEVSDFLFYHTYTCVHLYCKYVWLLYFRNKNCIFAEWHEFWL